MEVEQRSQYNSISLGGRSGKCSDSELKKHQLVEKSAVIFFLPLVCPSFTSIFSCEHEGVVCKRDAPFVLIFIFSADISTSGVASLINRVRT